MKFRVNRHTSPINDNVDKVMYMNQIDHSIKNDTLVIDTGDLSGSGASNVTEVSHVPTVNITACDDENLDEGNAKNEIDVNDNVFVTSQLETNHPTSDANHLLLEVQHPPLVLGGKKKMAQMQGEGSLPFYHGSNFESMSRIVSGSGRRQNTGKMAQQGRLFAKRQTKRLILKDGSCSVVSKNVSHGQNSFFHDIFTSLLDMRWRYNMVAFVCTFVGSWFFFAVLWWLMAFFHGDHLINDKNVNANNDGDNIVNSTINNQEILNRLDNDHDNNSVIVIHDRPSDKHISSHVHPAQVASTSFFNFETSVDKQNETKFANIDVTNKVACVEGVYNFITALLFSIETQQTIGYGTRYLNTHCTPGTLLLVIQACLGILLQSLMTGVVFSKLSRPKHRAHTMMFSKFAVICQRDDEYCLLFRVGDTRKSYLIGTSIRALVIKSKDDDSNFFPNFQHSLDLEMDEDAHDNSIFLIWPVTVVHRIDKNSPLWNISVEDLFTAKFEIVIVLQGTIEHTGMTAQFCTSYLPFEILWGHRLAPLLTYQNADGKYEIEFAEFHKVIPIKNMPDCSAKMFADKKEQKTQKTKNDLVGFATIFKRQGSTSLWPRVLKMLKKDNMLNNASNKDDTDSHNPDNYERSITPDFTGFPEKRPSFKNKRQSIDFVNVNKNSKHYFKTSRSSSLKPDIDETAI